MCDSSTTAEDCVVPAKSIAAPGESLADRFPEVAAELCANLVHPALGPDRLKPGSGYRCRWRCSQGHEWVASVVNRTGLGTGCRDCSYESRGRKLAVPGPGVSLRDCYPELAAECVEVVERPELGPGDLARRSGLRCRWQCGVCGHQWAAAVITRSSGGKGCPECGNRARSEARYRLSQGQPSAVGVRPDLVAEFVANLTSPSRGLDVLRPRSNCRCRWRCVACGHEWEALVSHRVSGTGCPECGRRRAVEALRRPDRGESVADVRPDLAAQFVDNVTVPGRGPEGLMPGSTDLCRWRCARGHEWPAQVNNRSNGSGCSRCVSHGKSRLELEVAELVVAATGLRVEVDQRPRGSRDRQLRVDLHLPELQLWVDVDPRYWHSRPERDLGRDRRKIDRMTHLDYVRLRSTELPALTGPVVTVEATTPWQWAQGLEPVLTQRGATWRDLDDDEQGHALARAMMEWSLLTGAAPSTSVLSVAPALAQEFVANETRPGVGLDLLAPHSPDACWWRCHTCGHEWRAPVGSRATRNHGCKHCAAKRRGREAFRAVPGQSLADKCPHVVGEFVRCFDEPGRTPQDLRPGSDRRCLWCCRDCGHEWSAPASRRAKGYGCRRCALRKTAAKRTRAEPGTTLADLYPAIAAEFICCVDEPGRTPMDLLPGSDRRCRWRCASCGRDRDLTVGGRVGTRHRRCQKCRQARNQSRH